MRTPMVRRVSPVRISLTILMKLLIRYFSLGFSTLALISTDVNLNRRATQNIEPNPISTM